jgi:hypothetical protein
MFDVHLYRSMRLNRLRRIRNTRDDVGYVQTIGTRPAQSYAFTDRDRGMTDSRNGRSQWINK